VYTAAEALQRLPETCEGAEPGDLCCDVLLLDYNLPGMNALEVLKEVRQRRGLDVPGVVVTGRGDEEKAVQALKLGAADYVVKNTGYLYKLPSVLENAFRRVQLARKQAALRESERRYRNIFNGIRDAVFVESLSGGILDVNSHACEMFGYARDEFLTKTVDDIVPSGGLVLLPDRLPETGMPSQPIETVNIRANGERFPVEITAQLQTIGDETVLLVVVRDITGRKRAEADIARASDALRQYAERLRVLHAIDGAILAAWSPEEIAQASLRHLRRLVPCVGAGIALFNVEGQEAVLFALDTDAETETKMGIRFPIEGIVDIDVLGQDRVCVIEDVQASPRPAAVMEVRQAMGVCSYVVAPLIAHGELIGCLALGTGTPSGFPPEHVDIAREVADQLAVGLHQAHLRAALEAEERRLQALVEHLPEGLVLLDSERRVLLSNPAARRHLPALTDAAASDALTHLNGHPLEQILEPPPEGLWHELEIAGPPRRVLEVLAQPLAEAYVEGWVLLIRDVTEAREIQQRVQHQERLVAVGQLAGGIAHDFNNLLTTIMLYAHRPLKRPDLPLDVKEAFQTILAESQGAADLVQQIMDFSRRSPIEVLPMDLKPFVKEAVRVLGRTIPESVRVRLEAGPGQHVVKADPTRIQQVLMNLALNARDAMPEGGELCVRLSRTEAAPSPIEGSGAALNEELLAAETPGREWVCLAVSDTGTGIPPDVLPHIYEPFFTTKSRGAGTGLGLSQVYGIVKQHGGHIDVETEPGRGTIFRVYLPVYQPEEEGEAVSEVAPPPPEGRGETILLVEDQQRIRVMMQTLLESLGYRVLSAANGQEALDVCRTAEGIDLVLTDVVMPEMGGKRLIQELRSRGMSPNLKALAITGHFIEQDADALKEAGFSEVVLKPFDIGTLAEAVRRVLDAD